MIDSQFAPSLGFWLFEGLDMFQTRGSFLSWNRKPGKLKVTLLKFLFFGHVNLRRKRKLTAVTNKTTMAHNCHGKIYLLTAKSISSQQNQFRHGKINFITAKLISPRQNQFRKRKINLAIAKSISPGQNQIYTRDNQFHNTAKSISLKTKSFSLTTK